MATYVFLMMDTLEPTALKVYQHTGLLHLLYQRIYEIMYIILFNKAAFSVLFNNFEPIFIEYDSI